ncbi:hypothetical protein HK096_010163 [Nowakowskiella sp. JEL0078]|nr:hypothetical protein HK096_010163 [Nowakowskiella sp. JEL0078]
MDLASPYSVLLKVSASPLSTFKGKVEFLIVGESTSPIETTSHFPTTPTHSFDNCPQLDVILIPGGVGTFVAAKNKNMLSFLQKQEPGALHMMSICTGSSVFASAGFLKNRKATSNKAYFDFQTVYDSQMEWVFDARFVIDGKFITASGVSAGVDAGFELSSILFGNDARNQVSKDLHYKPLSSGDDPFSKIHKRQGILIKNLLYSFCTLLGGFLTQQAISVATKTKSKSGGPVSVILFPTFDFLDVSVVLEALCATHNDHWIELNGIGGKIIKGGAGNDQNLIEVTCDRIIDESVGFSPGQEFQKIVFIPSVNSASDLDHPVVARIFETLKANDEVVVLFCGSHLKSRVTKILGLGDDIFSETSKNGWIKTGKWVYADTGFSAVTAMLSILVPKIGEERVKQIAIIMELSEELMPEGIKF